MQDHWLLGSKVTSMSVDELFDQVDQIIAAGGRETILNTNIHGIQLDARMPWLRDFRNRTRIVHVDGAGVILGARLLGMDVGPRICINDFFWPMTARCAEKGHSLFLLGGQPDVMDRAAAAVRRQAPDVVLAGAHHGYFDKSGRENDAMVEAINRIAPNILLVGFGMPVQERWVMENAPKLNANVIMVVGGFFDRLSGAVPLAPAWVTDRGLEWLYLSLHRPRRLVERYMMENPVFLARVLAARLRAAVAGNVRARG